MRAREGVRARLLRRLAQVALVAFALLGICAAPASAANVTVSGVAIERLVDALGQDWASCNGVTNNVRLVVDAGAHTQTVPCDATTGAFSFANVPLSATHLISIYLVGSGSEQGVLYTRNADTTSAITGLVVSEDFIRLRGVTGPITNATINTWDNSNDAAIPAISTGVALTTTVTQRVGVMVDAGSTFQPGGNVTVDKAIIEGTWTSGAEVLEITGTGDSDCDDLDSLASMDPICRRGAGTFNAGTGTLRLTLAGGTSHSDINGPFTFNEYQIHPANNLRDICIADNGTITAANVEIGDGSTVAAHIWGSLIVTNGTGNVTVAAGATLDGAGYLEARGNFTGAGTVDSDIDVKMRPNGGTVLLGSTAGAANWTFYELNAETAGAAATVRAATGGTGSLTVQDDIWVGLSTDAATTTLDLDTNDRLVNTGWLIVNPRGHAELSSAQPLTATQDVIVYTTLDSNGGTVTMGNDLDIHPSAVATMLASNVTVGGDAWIAAGASYTVAGAGQLNVGGDFIKSGTFTPGTGTVSFTDPARISFLWQDSATTFFNLRNITPDKVLRIDRDFTTTVSNQLTLAGSSCTARASLASSVDGLPFAIAAGTVSANFADIGDSNQTSGARIATNSWNHGGNTNWTFNTPCTGHTVSGVALQTEGGAGWSQCNGVTANVSLSINGFSPTSVPCTAGTGAFTFTTSLEPDQMLVAFLDPAASGDKGATFSRGPSPVANMTGLTIVLGQARMRSETATALTNVDLLRYDDTFDSDIPVSIDDVTRGGIFASSSELLIEAGDTYAPMYDTSATALDIAGTLGSVGNIGNDFTVQGVGTNASCTAALGTSVPVCLRGAGAIAMAPLDEFRYTGQGALHVAAATYPNLELESSSGGPYTYQVGTSGAANQVNVSGYLRIGANNIVSTSSFNPDVTVGDDLDLNGTISGSGTGTLSISDDLDGGGTLNLTAGTLRFLGQSTSSSEMCDIATATYSVWDMEIANADTATRTVTAIGPCSLVVRNDLRIGRVTDTNTSALNLDPGDMPVDVNGDVIITTRGDLGASSAATMSIASDFTNNGAFTANGGTVDFDTAGTTSNVFHTTATAFANLRVQVQPKQLRFQNARTTTISGTFTATGTSCTAPVEVRSTTGGSQYTLAIGTVATSYVTLMDAVAAPAKTVPLTGDLGNNSGWTFSGGCTPGPGSLYTDDSDASAGSVNEVDIGSDDFHMSWVNAGAMAFDQQQARVISTPLTNVLALWQFDTATGQAADTSGNGRALTLTGAPTSPAGQTGFSEALGLDGTTQHASITDAALQLSTNFTVETWVRAPDTTGTKVILERTNAANRNFRLDFSGGTLRAHATRNAGATFTVSTSAAPFADLAWHHVALTVDATNTLRLYLDGVSVGTPQALGGVTWSGAAPMSIGRSAVGTEYFPGQVDDVRISDTARTADELIGYAKLREPHNRVIWTSAALPGACASAARCADIVYTGPALRRPDARYYAQARGRLQAWVSFTAWGAADWFETSALLSIAIPGGNVALGTTIPGSNALAVRNVEVESTLSAGYRLYISDASDTAGMAGAGTLPDWTAAWDDPQLWPQATHGYFGATLLTGPNKDTVEWGTGTLPDSWGAVKYVGVRNTTPTLLVNRPGPTGTTDTYGIGVRAAPSTSTPAGAYSTTLTFTAIANP